MRKSNRSDTFVTPELKHFTLRIQNESTDWKWHVWVGAGRPKLFSFVKWDRFSKGKWALELSGKKSKRSTFWRLSKNRSNCHKNAILQFVPGKKILMNFQVWQFATRRMNWEKNLIFQVLKVTHSFENANFNKFRQLFPKLGCSKFILSSDY